MSLFPLTLRMTPHPHHQRGTLRIMSLLGRMSLEAVRVSWRQNPLQRETLEKHLQLNMNLRKTQGVRNPRVSMNPKRTLWRRTTLRKAPWRNLWRRVTLRRIP